VQITDAQRRTDRWAAAHYSSDPESKAGYREPVLCSELGLAIEPLADDGGSIQQLWAVL
jgi:hypothetical protein